MSKQPSNGADSIVNDSEALSYLPTPPPSGRTKKENDRKPIGGTRENESATLAQNPAHYR